MSQSRGRGRVLERSSKIAAKAPDQQRTISLPALPQTAHSAADSALATTDAPNTSDWRCAASVAASSKPVQELPAAAASVSSSACRRLLQSGQPVLLRQLQLAQCRLHNTKNTSHTNSSTTQQVLPVLCSRADANRFVSADPDKNLPGSYYHVRKPETSTMHMSFTEFLACWQTWTQHHRLLLQVHAFNWELYDANGTAAQGHASPPTATTTTSSSSSRLRVWPNTAVHPHLSQLLQPVNTPTTAGSVAQHMLDWPLLQQLLQAGQWAGTGSLHLLAGGSDALLPARYETHDRLLCQVAGRQRLLLLPPDLAFRGLYPYPVHHAYDMYSAVDWEEPELEHWPAAAQVSGLLCDLSPGDTLLVPSYWFVHSQLMQPACVSLEVRLTPQPERLSSPAALLLQLSRMVEVWFAAEAGPANVRRWLLALSEGREWQMLEQQLMTVKGYKLLQCCSMALQQLQSVLSLLPAAEEAGGLEGAARKLLGLMCEGRLVPTTGLNEGIRDPLYLQNPPQYHLIQEDAEAARYSSLFRHRLIANRPDWMQHATPLQLAPPGSRRSLVIKPAAAAVGIAAPEAGVDTAALEM